MEREYNISSLTLLLGIGGSLFIFAAMQKIIGDSIGLTDMLNRREIVGAIAIFVISWVATLTILLVTCRSIRTGYSLKTSMTIGVVIGSMLLPIMTLVISPVILFGSMDFDIKADYLDILRNLAIGTISIVMMWKWERQHSA